jgi:Family of unknown function (DUF6776)
MPGYLLGFIVIALVVLVALIVLYWPTQDKGTPESQIESLQQKIERQSEVIETLTKEKTDLLQRIAKQQQLSQIDRESQSRVQEELKNYQNERLKMEEELVFLRSMVSSKSGSSVLRIQRLRLLPGKKESSFVYTFTVSKVLKDSEYIDGKVYLELTGEQDGKRRTLPLKELTMDKKNSLKMRFKYFQNIEGELLLPSRFVPSGVTIEVKPDGKKFVPIKKSFEWVVIS